MHAATQAIGLLASLTSFVLWVPQGLRVWRGRRDPAALEGVVLGTQMIALAGALLWGLYAALIGSFWLGAPSVVTIPITVMTMAVVLRARRACLPCAPSAPQVPTGVAA